jgi:hypothetical protein
VNVKENDLTEIGFIQENPTHPATAAAARRFPRRIPDGVGFAW